MSKMVNVYGINPSPEWLKLQEGKEYAYLEALIGAEKINPEDDYEKEREIELLRKIASSACSQFQRERLVRLLINE